MSSPSSSSCTFCKISEAYPPSQSPVPDNPDPELIFPNCYLVLSTEQVLAFLDIMPIAEGHILVIPRTHRNKLGDLTGSEGAALGLWLPPLCRAIMKSLGRAEGDWNVVQNNGASAAQVVPHVHYHIIPRGGKIPDAKSRSWTMFARGQRDDLDDEEAAKLATSIRKELQAQLEAMQSQDSKGWSLFGKL